MKRAPFVSANAPRWESFERMLTELEQRKRRAARDAARPGPAQLDAFPREYRRLCRDYGLAQHRSYGEPLTGRLNRVALRGYRQLYRRRAPLLDRIAAFALRDFPALVRQERQSVLLALALFAIPFCTLWLGCQLRPSWVYYVLDGDTIAQFEEMYDPGAERVGRPSGSNAMMFGFYIRNNVGIAFRTFAGGLLLGLGSTFFLFYNGLIMGAVFGYLSSAGMQSTLYPFVIGHGSFELTAIVLAGAAGLKLGAAIVAPGRRTRRAALLQNARTCAGLMWGVFGMLVIAAFIEGFWSPSGAPAELKYAVGAALWALVVGYLTLAGRHRAA